MRVGQRGWLALAFVSVSVVLACGGGAGPGGGGGGGGSATPTPGSSPTPFAGHPAGYSAATAHGVDFNNQATNPADCRTCHASDLTGGTSGISCDTASCHGSAAWRTNCVFCHGGMSGDTTGAPPYDVLTAAEVAAGQTTGNSTPNLMSFGAHLQHVTDGATSGNLHPVWDCNQCHVKPTDVLTQGHIYGSIATAAPVTFTGGLDPQAQWNRTSKICSNSYCHGSGVANNGSWSQFDGTPNCNTCHRSDSSLGTGNHGTHVMATLAVVVACNQCHPGTVDASNNITGPTLHVNGKADYDLSATGVTTSVNGATITCNGSCHLGGPNHNFAW